SAAGIGERHGIALIDAQTRRREREAGTNLHGVVDAKRGIRNQRKQQQNKPVASMHMSSPSRGKILNHCVVKTCSSLLTTVRYPVACDKPVPSHCCSNRIR